MDSFDTKINLEFRKTQYRPITRNINHFTSGMTKV